MVLVEKIIDPFIRTEGTFKRTEKGLEYPGAVVQNNFLAALKSLKDQGAVWCTARLSATHQAVVAVLHHWQLWVHDEFSGVCFVAH